MNNRLASWRKQLEQRAQVINRIQKVLEGANIKLAAVAKDILGVSGRAMREAMITGIEDPAALGWSTPSSSRPCLVARLM
jgi:hypothetical protein